MLLCWLMLIWAATADQHVIHSTFHHLSTILYGYVSRFVDCTTVPFDRFGYIPASIYSGRKQHTERRNTKVCALLCHAWYIIRAVSVEIFSSCWHHDSWCLIISPKSLLCSLVSPFISIASLLQINLRVLLAQAVQFYLLNGTDYN